ncbi:hypothetical protein RIF29_27471 [Crotalaria pallida]|uniref:BHLH domain-containing protein n=1 Tax=Crotalaria pallida TaxID=3830 RepID=A0AAN9ERH7_CROPI
MGFLLKEALQTLCARNHWSYAVFWKIGSNNSKLLIWEECYYEPLPSPSPAHIFGTSNLPYQDGEGCWFSSVSQSSEPGFQEEDRVCSLINKMTINNSVNVTGEGVIGRAAFTGNHQWILLDNFTRDAYPPEVFAELHHQFLSGMQTVAIIPVLPHGVVQVGSFLPIMEDLGFVNDVKGLILQLGCVPGALLSEDYSAKLSMEILDAPSTAGVPDPIDPPLLSSNCTSSVANGSNQLTNSSHAWPTVQTSYPQGGEINSFHVSVSTFQSHNLNQIFNSLCQPRDIPMIEQNFSSQQQDIVMEAEVIPSNLGSCLQQQSVSYKASSARNDLSSFSQSSLSDHSLKYMEQQIMSAIGSRDHVNPSKSASRTINISQLKTDQGLLLDHSQSSGSTSIPGGIPIHCGMSSLLRTNLITSSDPKPPEVSTAALSGEQEVGIGLQNKDSTKAGGYSQANLTSESRILSMPLEGSDPKILPVDLKCGNNVLASTDQRIVDGLLQAPNIPSLHFEEHMPMSGLIPGFAHDCLTKDSTSQSVMKMNAKHEKDCVQPSFCDDLFDVLGLDFKNKLLNGDWSQLFADESDANEDKLDKKGTCLNRQDIGPDCYSVNEAVSDSGIFLGTSSDHLLDAVVSRGRTKAIVKQNSDDMSCRTTLTSNSTSSVSHRQVMSDHFQGGLSDFPKNGGKTGSVRISSLRSGCSKDDGGNCSQTTSIYGSQLTSLVDNSSSVTLENSVSSGYSKRPDDSCKSNHKKHKPGVNPKPRPKDRQLIQDRVKELREIVPNGAKCSIDALLEKTIKHMLFLESVAKHADQLKQTGESKIIEKEDGLVLKDNFLGGTTWAYEVGSQSIVCPFIVEDLNPPRQMLVEMLCEERGFFLEIADLIRGLGLTILKGVIESHNDKIWACFTVEANGYVKRMEIFMSLVSLLEQTVNGSAPSSNTIDNIMIHHSCPQATL